MNLRAEWEKRDAERQARFLEHNAAAIAGGAARRAGMPVNACPPYTDASMAITWRLGWASADLDASRQQQPTKRPPGSRAEPRRATTAAPTGRTA